MNETKEPGIEQSPKAVQLSIWEDTKGRGKFYFKVTVLRRYQLDDDDYTKTTSYTGPSNKTLVSEMVQIARRWLQKDNPMQSKEF